METQKIVISQTAWAAGWGKDPYKWSAGFSQEEREMLKSGEGMVVIEGCRPARGLHGTTDRVATYAKGRYGRRTPTQQEQERINSLRQS